MSVAELQEKRSELAQKIRDHANAKYDDDKAAWASSADEQIWNRLNEDYDQNKASLDAALNTDGIRKRLELVQAGVDDPSLLPVGQDQRPGREDFSGAIQSRSDLRGGLSVSDNARMLAISAWMKGQYHHPINSVEMNAAESCGVSPYAGYLDLCFPPSAGEDITAFYELMGRRHRMTRPGPRASRSLKIFNAPLTTTDPATGGNLIIPEILLAALEINMLAFGGMREISDMIITSGGETMGWPTSDDTGNKGRIIPENEPADDNAGQGTSGEGGPNPSFGKNQWGAFKYSSDTILVPFELLEDSIVSLPPVLGAMLGERIGRATNEHYTTGDGTNKPIGILTAGEDSGIVPAGIAITADDTIALQHAVDLAYRGGAVYMCHDATVLGLRLLKDDNGRYLWQDGLQAGVPDRLNGSEVVVNQDMPVVAANAKPLLFVQRGRYKIRRVNQMRLYRLQERYRERDQDGFVAFLREDGNLLNAGTNPAKYLTMPAS